MMTGLIVFYAALESVWGKGGSLLISLPRVLTNPISNKLFAFCNPMSQELLFPSLRPLSKSSLVSVQSYPERNLSILTLPCCVRLDSLDPIHIPQWTESPALRFIA